MSNARRGGKKICGRFSASGENGMGIFHFAYTRTFSRGIVEMSAGRVHALSKNQPPKIQPGFSAFGMMTS